MGAIIFAAQLRSQSNAVSLSFSFSFFYYGVDHDRVIDHACPWSIRGVDISSDVGSAGASSASESNASNAARSFEGGEGGTPAGVLKDDSQSGEEVTGRSKLVKLRA